MIFGKRVEAGLDIGSYALHWAACDSRTLSTEVCSKPLFLQGMGDLRAPGVVDRIGALLKECEGLSKLWTKQVVVGVQGTQVVSGYLELPSLEESEKEMAVISSVSREIPFPVHTMDIVHLPVKSLSAGKSAVFYSAWPKEQGHLLEKICRAGELKIKRMEVTGIGLTREVFRNHALDPEQFHFLINIGHELTHLLFVKGGYPYYLRDIAIGGKHMTEAIALRNGLSWSEAQSKKENSEIGELSSSLGSLLSELVFEFRRTIDYFQRRFQVQSLGQIFLSGGSALLGGLPDWLESRIGHPLQVDSWNNLMPKNNSSPALYKAALGLALGK